MVDRGQLALNRLKKINNIQGKRVDASSIGNGKVLAYNSTTGKIEYQSGVGGDDHSTFTNLDYASAGHTGFVSSSDLTTHEDDTSTHGIADTFVLAVKNANNNFTAHQTLGANYVLSLSSSQADDAGEILKLKYLDTTNISSKAIIAFENEAGASKAWLVAHKNLDAVTAHNHFSIEISDALGALQSRLIFPYDQDYIDIMVNQANLKLHRNLGQTNGNLLFENGGSIKSDSDIALYPNNQGDRALKIVDGTTSVKISAAGSTILYIDDNLTVNGNITATGTLASAGFLVGATAGVDGTFTTADSKTVTVTKGIITTIAA